MMAMIVILTRNTDDDDDDGDDDPRLHMSSMTVKAPNNPTGSHIGEKSEKRSRGETGRGTPDTRLTPTLSPQSPSINRT